jgi:hypothetical protein
MATRSRRPPCRPIYNGSLRAWSTAWTRCRGLLRCCNGQQRGAARMPHCDSTGRTSRCYRCRAARRGRPSLWGRYALPLDGATQGPGVGRGTGWRSAGFRWSVRSRLSRAEPTDDRRVRIGAVDRRNRPTRRDLSPDAGPPRESDPRADSDRTAPEVPEGTDTPDASEPAPFFAWIFQRLPDRPGNVGPTSGILTRPDGRQLIHVRSGTRGPGAGAPGLGGRTASLDSAREHAEGHAAAIMRRPSMPREMTLYVNKRPCGGRYGCDNTLEWQLPPGAKLTVYWPGGYKVYIGDGRGLV